MQRSALSKSKTDIQIDFENLITDLSKEVIESSVNQTFGDNIHKLNNETIKVEKVRSQLNNDARKISEILNSLEEVSHIFLNGDITQGIDEIQQDINMLSNIDEVMKKSKNIQQSNETLELLKNRVLLIEEMNNEERAKLNDILQRQHHIDKRMTTMFYAVIFVIILLLFVLAK